MSNLSSLRHNTIVPDSWSLKEGIKEAISQTTGGKIADEIRNPGQAKQQREDSKLVAAAEASGAMEEISQKAGEIRGTDAKEETSEDEISNFANKSDQ